MKAVKTSTMFLIATAIGLAITNNPSKAALIDLVVSAACLCICSNFS